MNNTYRQTRRPGRSNASGGSRVRGPNSALTEFLREQGIDANEIARQHAERVMRDIERENMGLPPEEREEEDQLEEQEQEGDEEGEQEATLVGSSSRTKRRKRTQEEEEDWRLREVLMKGTVERPSNGSVDFCAECNVRFTVTAYSRESKDGTGLLCDSCGSKYAALEKQARNAQIADRKKRKVIASALLDRQHYQPVKKLQDLCIKVTVEYIEDISVLGEIGSQNLDKLRRILSRNRSLTNSTVKLFFDPTLQEFELWDCSSLSAEVLKSIASFCPSIEKLTLEMCGQINDSVLHYYQTNLTKLESLRLGGPFLVTKASWIELFKSIGPRLREFALSNSFQFDNECLESLVNNCPNLETLDLSHCEHVGQDSLLLISRLKKLKHLQLAYLNDITIGDETIVEVLSNVGANLYSLHLVGAPLLTDKFFSEGLIHCEELQSLWVEGAEDMTDEGVGQFFTLWNKNRGLIEVSLRRCLELADATVGALIKHSHRTLVNLNLNSLRGLTKETFNIMSKTHPCTLLTTLDVGFVRCVDDEIVQLILEGCPSLDLMEVFGDNHVTSRAKLRKDFRLIGLQDGI